MKKIDVAIIGAGPAGLAAAIYLYSREIKNIILFDRNPQIGGILKQCIHPGFGLDYFKEELTGPQYALKMKKLFDQCEIPLKLNTSVINISKNKIITASSLKEGVVRYNAKAIIFATGCRERTRENLEIPGTRPSGIFMAGQAQNLINNKNLRIGKNVIIQGSGDIGLIMARRLKIEGYKVIKVFERLHYLSGLIRNKVQCLDDFNIPIEFNSQISDIVGGKRVSGVYVQKLDKNLNPIVNSEKFYKCDTILFSVGLIPETELLKKAGAVIIDNFSPKVNNKYETTVSGIFCCGNSLHINDLADNASLEGEAVAGCVIEYLRDKSNFKKSVFDHLPYKLKINDEKYNDDFFKSIKNQKICIICPKGCIVSKTKSGCKRGKLFYENECVCKKRKFTTTFKFWQNGTLKIFSIISKEEIDIRLFPEIKRKLRKINKVYNDNVALKIDNKIIEFKLAYL